LSVSVNAQKNNRPPTEKTLTMQQIEYNNYIETEQ